MRQIRQLQTAWWVFPSAEHSRFQHILGVMHLASQAVVRLYPSLKSVDPSTPPITDVDCLMRMAGLLHDVGHGPFGHFFDAHFLQHFGMTHESLGAHIIRERLASSLQRLRLTPMGRMSGGINVEHLAWIIQRPGASSQADNEVHESYPVWLRLLRSLFCGIYTVDNMDFVLRDAYMTGLSPRSFDLQRILHYSSFTEHGLTIHDRGMPALVHFLSMKAELFRSVYFHRTVRAIDLQLAELFRESRDLLFPGDPREHLDEYLQLTEFSLLTDVRRWQGSKEPRVQHLGGKWKAWLERRVPWQMICQRNLSFSEGQSEGSSIFSSPHVFKESVREKLPVDLRDLPFAVDLARHIHRPHTVGAATGLNFYFDAAARETKPLTMHGLYRRLPVSHTIARIYAHDREHVALFAGILDALTGTHGEDDLTNM